MEYRGYTPDEVKKDKRKAMRAIVFLCAPLLLGIFVLIGSIARIATIRVTDVSEISYESMVAGDVYYFDNMVLVDAYAQYGDQATGYSEIDYYIVSFTDGDGKRVYASVQEDEYNDFREKCQAYVEDESLTVGDVVLSGCFHGYNIGTLPRGYFNTAYEYFNEEMPGEILDISFFYDEAETVKDYYLKQVKSTAILLPMIAIFIIPCAIGIAVQVRKRKQLDQYIAEYNGEPYNYY